jgi:hypothetical protein
MQAEWEYDNCFKVAYCIVHGRESLWETTLTLWAETFTVTVTTPQSWFWSFEFLKKSSSPIGLDYHIRSELVDPSASVEAFLNLSVNSTYPIALQFASDVLNLTKEFGSEDVQQLIKPIHIEFLKQYRSDFESIADRFDHFTVGDELTVHEFESLSFTTENYSFLDSVNLPWLYRWLCRGIAGDLGDNVFEFLLGYFDQTKLCLLSPT